MSLWEGGIWIDTWMKLGEHIMRLFGKGSGGVKTFQEEGPVKWKVLSQEYARPRRKIKEEGQDVKVREGQWVRVQEEGNEIRVVGVILVDYGKHFGLYSKDEMPLEI